MKNKKIQFNKKRKKARGFSLLEVMISAGLMGIGFTGVISAITSTSAQMAHQKYVTEAVNVAESMMEDLLTRRRNDPDLTEGEHNGPSFNEVGERRSGGLFRTTWKISDEDGALDLLKRMKVTVTWDEKGTDKTISFTTLRR